MKIFKLRSILGCFLLFFFSFLRAQTLPAYTSNITTNVNEVQFVFDDVNHFIDAHARLASTMDSLNTLDTYYFSKASPGLKMFIQRYNLTKESLLTAIRKYPRKFDSVKYVPAIIARDIPYYLSMLDKYKTIFSSVKFPPFYFLIGAMEGINSGSTEGVLFEVENWKPQGKLRYASVLVHELTHFQQGLHVGIEKYISIYGAQKSLLAITIREGVGEFFANLITGVYTQEQSRVYLQANKASVWQRFKEVMLQADTQDWMWVKPKDVNQPRDLGYVLGAAIAQAYYEKALDKENALKEILSITDYPWFLNASGYGQ